MLLITGGSTRFYGQSSDTKRSVTIFDPDNNTSCSLPVLPQGRNLLTLEGGLACGGLDDAVSTSCVKWTPAGSNRLWSLSHSLRQKRYGHVSWATASGVYLIGGDYSPSTSELVKPNGRVREGFSLKYESRYAHLIYF